MTDEQFRFHIAQVRELGRYLCGRRLYETMLPTRTFGSRVIYERYGRASR
jgi:hypothetical protein